MSTNTPRSVTLDISKPEEITTVVPEGGAVARDIRQIRAACQSPAG